MHCLRALALCGLLLTPACGSALAVSPPDAKLAFDAKNEDALIVLHVTPRTGVIVAGGDCEKYGWAKFNGARRQHFWSAEGYIVVKATPTRGKEAYAVVAVRPERFTSFADEKPFTNATVMWRRFLVDRGAFYGLFLISPALAGTMMGAQGGPIIWGAEDRGQFAYSPRSGVNLPTFTAVAGQVSYVGAIRVEASQRDGVKAPPKSIAITPILSPDALPAAAQFIATHYPNVHVPVTYRPLEMVPRDEASDE